MESFRANLQFGLLLAKHLLSTVEERERLAEEYRAAKMPGQEMIAKWRGE